MSLFTREELLLFNRSSINIENTLMFFICVVSSMAIYASDTTLSTKFVQMVLVGFVYVSVIIIGFRLLSKRLLKFSPLLLSPIIYVLICYFNSSEHKFNMLLLLDLLLFLSLSDDSKTFIYLLFRKYMVLMSVFGIIAYSAFSLSLPIPYDTVSYYSEYSSSEYLNYHFSYLIISLPYVRLCGLFNEPGYFGTIAAFILCIERMNLKRKGNMLILLASIFTFSVAFYVIVFFYAVLMARRNKVAFVVLLLLLMFVFFIMPNIDMGASFDKLIERFSFTDGKFAGDNRSDEAIDDFVIEMLGTPKIYWGYGMGYANSLTHSISTYKTIIIDHGIIGFILIYGSLLLTTFKYAKSNIYVMLFLICFFISIYQRPNIYSLTYFVILFGGISYINKQSQLEQSLRQ